MQEHPGPRGDWQGDGDPDGVELIAPEDFLPRHPFPVDAQRMGIDRWSDNAGLIAVAASLDPAKRWHRMVAWVMLVAVCVPLAFQLWFQLTAV